MGNKMSDPVLSQLLSADSDLATQETKLIAQLEAIQAKRASLQSVLEIFGPDKATAADTNGSATAQIANVGAAPSLEKPAKSTSKPGAKETKAKPTQPRKPAAQSKANRRGWQKYMRVEHGQTPLPMIVYGILKAKPKKLFEIAEVIDAIVEESIPHSIRKNARNRISNILAEGARKREWYRPKAGCYRFAK